MKRFIVSVDFKGIANVNTLDLNIGSMGDISPLNGNKSRETGEDYEVTFGYTFSIIDTDLESAYENAMDAYNEQVSKGYVDFGDIRNPEMIDNPNTHRLFDIYEDEDYDYAMLSECGLNYDKSGDCMYLEVTTDARSILIGSDESLWYHFDFPNGEYMGVSLYQPGKDEKESILNTVAALRDAINQQIIPNAEEYIMSNPPYKIDDACVEKYENLTLAQIRKKYGYGKKRRKWYLIPYIK